MDRRGSDSGPRAGGGSAGARAATGATAELKTALEHAGFAEKQESLKTVTWHLHHVLNCLVGPTNPLV